MNIIKPDIKWNGALSPMKAIDSIALHHMAHSTAGIQDIHKWHLDRGWKGFGYNYWVDKKGNVYEGRGLNEGAGVLGENSHVLSIGFQGDYDSVDKAMPTAQFNAGVWICRKLIVDIPAIRTVHGHKYWNSTSCPGKYFPLTEMVTAAILERGEISMKDKVKDFQRRYGLDADGIPGPITKGKLAELEPVFEYIRNYVYNPKPVTAKVEYRKVGITDVLYVDPLDLRFAKVGKQARDITHKHFVNGMQFGTNPSLGPGYHTIGTGFSEGKKVTSRLPHDNVARGTFIVHKDGRVTVEQLIDPEKKYSDIWFCVQNVGVNPINLKAEWWPENVGRTTNRITIGYVPDTKKVVLTHRPDSNIQRARETLINLGCIKDGKVLGIVLDSGTPATFKYNGTYYRNGGYMDNIIFV